MNIFHIYSLKSLKKNKTRTLVTIIGIILSVAMITAVTTMVATIQNFGISYVIATSGDWHVYVNGVDSEKRQSFYGDDRVATTYDLRNVGYAYLEGCVNEYKPYLCIQAMNKDFINNMPLYLTEGRMPENDREILIPEHVYTNGGVEYALGDTLELEIGYRTTEDTMLWQKSELDATTDDGDNVKVNEKLITEYERTYTVVGFYERPSFEPYSAPGYTALTLQGEDFGCAYYDCYMIMKDPNSAIGLWEEISLEESYFTDYNSSLLRFYGLSSRADFNAVLYGMGSILIGIIMLGSVALIYNAFAISISERTKQFGLLSSIGATKKQMKKSICFEGLVLCLAGIPLGVISGIVGIGITLFCLRTPLQNIMESSFQGVALELHVSVASIVVAVIVGVVTVLISAYLPMRRALKVSAIDAIKQRSDIKLSQKSVRIPGFVGHLFGVEGTIAYKNYKRNKKQYRATVISLAMSIVLFVTAGSFTTYLFGSFDNSVEMSPYDISVMAYEMNNYAEVEELYEKMSKVKGVTPYNMYACKNTEIVVEERDLTDEALQILGNNQIFDVLVQFVPDDKYENMVQHYELDEETYADMKNVPAILMNSVCFWNENDEAMDFLLLKENCNRFYSLKSTEDEESDIVYYTGCEVREKDGHQMIVAHENIEAGTIEREIPVEDSVQSTLAIGDIINDLEGNYLDEIGIGCTSGMGITIIYPYSMMDTIMLQINRNSGLYTDMYFKAEDHKKAYDEMSVLLQYYSNASVYDYAASEEEQRSIFIMLQVFSYGFIILISLISAANVFNTISTNMNLRRREFAMLKSFGMTEKGFRKMMNFECILYGVKGLFYGLVIAIGLVIWMYYASMGNTLEGFYLPWKYVGIVVISVFAVVYSTMIYGRVKLKKENIVDALKNENQ